jgi:cellulose synthase/poly-beta-1,6-N-acetylglucosamine synthase-like glycosyltransferase
MDLIVQIHRWAAHHKRKIKMSFTSDPVCWTECPAKLTQLGRQRRRWQMGLCQTLWKSSEMLFNSKFKAVGMLSFPFHLYVEALGSVVEFFGYFMVPLALMFGMVPVPLFIMFLVLSLVYGSFLSVGSVLLEELTYRRYPSFRDLMILLVYAVIENIGYRQVVLYYRVQGVLKFIFGFRQWEKVTHVGATP